MNHRMDMIEHNRIENRIRNRMIDYRLGSRMIIIDHSMAKNKIDYIKFSKSYLLWFGRYTNYSF